MNRCRGFVGVCVLLLSTLWIASTSMASAATPAPTSVSGWTTTALTVGRGYPVSTPVTVQTGTGHAIRQVRLQRQTSTTSTWSTISTVSTTSAGAATITYVVPGVGTWAYRLYVAPTATAAGVTTASRVVTGTAGAGCSNPFVAVFDTRTNANNTIGLEFDGGNGLTVNWGGAGSGTPAGSGKAPLLSYGPNPQWLSYTYTTPGTYTVMICGSATHFTADEGYTQGPTSELTQLLSFGSLGLTDLSDSLADSFVKVVPAALPAGVTDLSGMFEDDWSFNYPVGSWDTSDVTDMNSMFSADSAFNEPIGSWNTSKVTDFFRMFNEDTAFNQPIGNWNTAAATNMNQMFWQDAAFNQGVSEIRCFWPT